MEIIFSEKYATGIIKLNRPKALNALNIKMAKEMGPGKNIVTILCDRSDRYNSKLFNKDFLNSKNLPIPNWI